MFWLGFICGIATVFAIPIVAVVWFTRGDPFDDMTDEHAEVLGIGADHFGGVSK